MKYSIVFISIFVLAAQGSFIPEKVNKVADENEKAYDPLFLEMVDLTVGTVTHSYFFSRNQKMNWMEAMEFCLSYGMDLASIETSAENLAIKNHIIELELPTVRFWLSGNKIGRTSYLWINGKFMTYSGWAVGRPNNAAANCMYLENGRWYDIGCETQYNYICELATVATPSAKTITV